MHKNYDVVVVGSGLSGLTVALKCANAGLTVAIVTKESLAENSSYYAQGGIAAVWDIDDSFESHIEDTLSAGAGLCDPSVVKYVVTKGPESVNWLIENGVMFSRRGQDTGHPEEFHLTREGGHSARRIIHAEDATGRRVESTLESRIRDHGKIEIFEKFIGIELITKSRLNSLGENRCLGIYALKILNEEVVTFVANAVVLATGGASKTYLYTSNPDTSTGDGIAMAWRAGCSIANMEFVQFHPTCLYHPHASAHFTISSETSIRFLNSIRSRLTRN